MKNSEALKPSQDSIIDNKTRSSLSQTEEEFNSTAEAWCATSVCLPGLLNVGTVQTRGASSGAAAGSAWPTETLWNHKCGTEHGRQARTRSVQHTTM